MATTTNYGWTTPDNTALVKDGAAAIRTLGSSIDTSMNAALGTKKAGMVLLNTTSFSGVSSLALPAGTFTSTYDSYKVIVDFSNTTALSASSAIRFKFRVSGTDSSTGYSFVGLLITPGSNTNLSDSNTSTGFLGSYLNSTPTRFGGTIELQGVAIAAETKFQVSTTSMDGGTNRTVYANGFHSVATAYDSMNFIPDSGTITGGNIRVYGYAK